MFPRHVLELLAKSPAHGGQLPLPKPESPDSPYANLASVHEGVTILFCDIAGKELTLLVQCTSV